MLCWGAGGIMGDKRLGGEITPFTFARSCPWSCPAKISKRTEKRSEDKLFLLNGDQEARLLCFWRNLGQKWTQDTFNLFQFSWPTIINKLVFHRGMSELKGTWRQHDPVGSLILQEAVRGKEQLAPGPSAQGEVTWLLDCLPWSPGMATVADNSAAWSAAQVPAHCSSKVITPIMVQKWLWKKNFSHIKFSASLAPCGLLWAGFCLASTSS